MKNKQIAIIGGGITGLSAAYSLLKEKKKYSVDFKLFEASHRLGGKIYTTYKDDFIIERGADSFLARKQSAKQLIDELGLTKMLVRNEIGKAYVLANEKLHSIPKGSYRGIPTKWQPYFTSSLFTLGGKIRGIFDLFLKQKKIKTDISLGELLRYRFGDEYVDYLIEPLLAGIYSGDIDQMSTRATLPELIKWTNEYKSIAKACRNYVNQSRKNSPSQKKGAFFTLKGGLSQLIDKLETKLKNNIEFEKKVIKIEKLASTYCIHFNDGTTYKADAVIIATEHKAVKQMFSEHFPIQSTLETIPTTSTANIALAYNDDSFLNDFHGTGFVVSRKSKLNITACTWTHKKWPTTTPKNKALLRTYVGKPNEQNIIYQSDSEIVEIVLKDLYKTMGIKEDPKFSIITRWPDGRAQYTVNHLKRIKDLKQYMKKHLPKVYLAGSSYFGVGIPDCIENGQKVVYQLLEQL